MNFQFEYTPVALKKFVQENFGELNLLPYPNYEKEAFKGTLERLRGQTDIQIKKPMNQFSKWLKELEPKYKELLPFIFDQLDTKEQQTATIQEIACIVKDKKIVFAHLLYLAYSKNDFVPYWAIMADAFKSSPDFYNKYWSTNIKEAWGEYIQTNRQVEFVGRRMLERITNMSSVLELYFVREEHEFYKSLYMYIFSCGPDELYRREAKRFKDFLKQADEERLQQLVTGFIRANMLDEMKDISKIISNKMGTYIKKPNMWSNMDQDVKERFHQWYLRKNIKEFFSGVSKNHERFVYWEKYIPRMKDALVLNDNKTILFYFNDVVIMEIIGTGAVYVYSLKTFEKHFASKVNPYRESKESETYIRYGYTPIKLERSMIMDKALVYKGGWLKHAGKWQETFDIYLKQDLKWEI